MGKVNWFRAIFVGVVFGLIYALSPKFLVGFFFGYMIMLLVIKIEDSASTKVKPERQSK